MRANRRAAFTLVELLIVVVILAILAATIIPQFTDATADTKKSSALMNLRGLRQQIEYYKVQHNGKNPDAALAKLLIKTDVDGNAGGDFGPYVVQIPPNPFTNSNKVNATTDNPPTAASSASDRGWLYNATTGGVWLDQTGYLDK
jgi:general secretion pathway protein G